MPSSEVLQFKQERERLRLEIAAGASGLMMANEMVSITRKLAARLWEAASFPPEASLAAVGSFGRGMPAFFSDLDLLIMHPKPQSVSAAVKAFSYDLYDTGLEIGLTVHTPKEALRLARKRFDVEASYRLAEPWAGSRDTVAALTDELSRLKGFRERLSAAVNGWRLSGGNAGADLEPNLKEGKGGLRDLSAIMWLDPGAPRFEEAEELLLTVRNNVHVATGRRTDVLWMQHQAKVARAFEKAGSLPAGVRSLEERLLQHLYKQCRSISRSLDELLDGVPGEPARFSEDLGPDGLWTETMRKEFFDVIDQIETDPNAVWRFLDDALVEALPEWRGIHCLPQRNVYHRYAVDAHSFEVSRIASRLAEDPDPLTARVATLTVEEGTLLILASLFHDIGKGTDEDHSVRGGTLAASSAKRMGLEGPFADDLEWLVRSHLLLSETATRRDIGDESIIIEIAEEVRDERRLRLLYLLTVADGQATGLSAWSKWKATLVGRLFTRVAKTLERGTLVGSNVSEIVRSHKEELRLMLADHLDQTVDAHLGAMPREWFLSQSLDSLEKQSRLLMEIPSPDEVRVHAIAQAEAGIWEVVVTAQDRPGLFSKVAGTLALHGLNVLGAQIYTRADGVALEIFRVEALGSEEHRFEHVSADAVKALKGKLSLDLRLAEKRRDYLGRTPKGKQEPPRVVTENEVSDFYTIIEVHATDQIGLLYAITKTLTDLSLDIHLAKVSTYAEDVVDVFYVRDLEGQKVTDPPHIIEIERTILHVLSNG